MSPPREVPEPLAAPPPVDEEALVAALRAGDETAFSELVRRNNASLLRLARAFVPSQAVAEEVVQETWLAVIQGIDRFEQRSSVRHWLFRILVNRARTRGVRERRSVPFSALASAEGSERDSGVDADSFFAPGHPLAGRWSAPPGAWTTSPEDALLAKETREVIARAIDRLPRAQGAVLTLRDVTGMGAEEVCRVLGINDGNQRVLLHRGRQVVRAALAGHLAPAGAAAARNSMIGPTPPRSAAAAQPNIANAA